MTVLLAPDLRRIAAQEEHTAAKRDRMRARWAEAAASRVPPPPEPIRPRVVIPLGPNAELAIRNRITFKVGPLSVVLPRLDQTLISRAAMRLQSGARAWPDGTMRGIKKLIWREAAEAWVSPSRGDVWKDGYLRAIDFDEGGDLRGEAGIHSVWPDHLDELNSYPGRLVEVSGWGLCTVGDLGWRAEHCRVVRELLPEGA